MQKMNFLLVITKNAAVVLLLALSTIPCSIASNAWPSPPCEDTLAATTSEVKDCKVFILAAPCGTVSYGGIDVNAVCAKTCGVCYADGDGNGIQTPPPTKDGGASSLCEDTLAATTEEVKDCKVYILGAPCGTVSYGIDVNAVCAKTCGVCYADGDGVQTLPPTKDGGASSLCEDTLAATTAQVKDCKVFILGAPCATVSYGIDVNAVCAKTCGVCTAADHGVSTMPPTAAPTETTSSPTPDMLAFNGSSCEDRLATSTSPVKDCDLLILKAPCGSVSFEIDVNAVCAKTCGVCNGGHVTTTSPSTVASTSSPTSGDVADGGASSVDKYTLDGLVQHEMLIQGDDQDARTLLVGGEYGWNNTLPGANQYADISVTADTILRFVYDVGFHNVALVPSAQALEDCDVSQAQILGDDVDSPFELSLIIFAPGDELFITSARESSTAQCQFGARFKVTVIANEEDDDDSGSSVVLSVVTLLAFVTLSAILY